MRSDIPAAARALDRALDDAYLLDGLTTFLRTPAEAPLGQNFIDPRDPQVAHFVTEVIKPRVASLEPATLTQDGDNNLVATWGGAGPTLLLMTYSSSHHGNLMEDPYSGTIESAARYGVDEVCAFGRGGGKKAALAAALAAVKALRDAALPIRGRLVVAVNTEGYSSTRGSEGVHAALKAARIAPDGAVMCFGTGLRGGIGTRGRVDILVDVIGRETHSSQPEQGLNAIDGAWMALDRLRRMRFETKHPRLGREQLTAYKLTFAPIAPHTMPETASFRLDRRIVPGTAIDAVVDEVRAVLRDLAEFRVEVRRGPYMLPWEADPGSPLVRMVARAFADVAGQDLELRYAAYTTDTGFTASHGIPVLEFGPRAYSEDDRPTAAEFVSVESVRLAARVYARTALGVLGAPT